MLYLIIVLCSVAVISAFNLLLLPPPLSPEQVGAAIFSVVLGALAVFLIDAISALIIRRLTPKSLYSPKKRIFRVSKRERDLYKLIKIKSWKDHVPELGGFTDFHKDKLESHSDAEYLERFIVEANYGVVIHLANALLGFLILFIPFCSSPTIWIPIFSVNFILSILPIFILRYTLYTLQNLYSRAKKRNKRQ